MAIIDNTLVLSDDQAITGDAVSTNVIDFGEQGTPYGWLSAYGRDVGEGYMEIPMLVQVTEDFNTLTSLDVVLEIDDNEAFSSATTVVEKSAIPLASLTAGYKVTLLARLPKGITERYMRLSYDVNGTNPTTGKIFAAIVAGDQTNTH